MEIKKENNSWNYWILIGLIWGLIMFVTMDLIYPFISGEEITWKNILIAIPIWIIFGLGFGAIMRWYKNRSDKKYSNQ